MDITPQVPEGRQLIQSYGGGRFRIAGTVHPGSVLVLRERTLPWPVTSVAEIVVGTLQPLLDMPATARPDILIVGCGPTMTIAPLDLRRSLKSAGIALEWMGTGAACRTFNILLAEERRVAAALVAVP